MNDQVKVNTLREHDVLDRCTMELKKLLGPQVKVALSERDVRIGKRVFDGRLTIDEIVTFFEVKAKLTGIQIILNHWKLHPENENPLIFFLPHLSLSDRLTLQEFGVNFIDTAGNCNLDLPGIKMVVNVRDIAPVSSPYTGKAFQRKGIILLFHFLVCPELLTQGYRTMKEQTGVSTGTVSGIIDDLRAQHFIYDHNGKPELTNIRALIERWSYSYLEILRPSLHRGYLISRDDSLIRKAQLMGINDNLFLGGQYAAMMLGDYLSSQKTIIYTTLRLAELNQRYLLKPSISKNEPEATELLSPFWNTSWQPKDPFKILFTPDILTYADLLLDQDSRVLKTAEKFLDNEIRNRFEGIGLQW